MQKQVNIDDCPGSSGAVRVMDPNPATSRGQAWLGTLLSWELQMKTDGWLHVYAGNGSSMDNAYGSSGTAAMCPLPFRPDGKARDQGPRSPRQAWFTCVNKLFRVASTTPISGFSAGRAMGHGEKYKNMYTGKELQTEEYWKASVSTGLEMYDYSLSLFAFKGARETASLSFEARFFDPQLGRWIVPDPAEQFSNPYLAMGNNPVVYVDPNGEIAFMAVVGIFAGVQLLGDMFRNDFKMNIGEIGMSLGLGAVQGALAFSGAGGLGMYAGCGAGWLTLGSAVAGQINIPIYEGDNFSLSISPSLATGTNGVRLGANAFASYRNGDFSISGGYSFGRNFSSWDLSEQMAEAKWSSISSISVGINGTDGGFNYGLTKYGGNYPQTVGRVGFNVGRFGFSHENDFLAPNNQDTYRTGRLGFSWQATDDLTLTAGFEVLTGNGTSTVPISEGRSQKQYIEDVQIRNGISSFGVQYRGNDYRVGWNSEGARAFMQNGWHDSMHIIGMKNSPWFERMNYAPAPYTYFGNTNPFTGYGF